MIQNNRAFQMISLAARAGKVKSGESQVEKAVKSGSAFLVIVAEDASANTKKAFQDMCSYYEVPITYFGTREELGHYTGKTYRASICILDEGFARSVKDVMRLNMEV